MSNYICCYYLLYKIYNSNFLWIVNISDDYKELKDKIRFVNDEEGSYILVERIEKKNIFDKKFKQYQIFFKKSNDVILFET